MSGLRSGASQPRRGIRSQVFPLEKGGPDKAAAITSLLRKCQCLSNLIPFESAANNTPGATLPSDWHRRSPFPRQIFKLAFCRYNGRIRATTRNFLLLKLMSGEIRVKDAENVVEAALQPRPVGLTDLPVRLTDLHQSHSRTLDDCPRLRTEADLPKIGRDINALPSGQDHIV